MKNKKLYKEGEIAYFCSGPGAVALSEETLKRCNIKIKKKINRMNMETEMSTKNKLKDIIYFFNISKLSYFYFGKRATWLYNKLDGVDQNGYAFDFTPDEMEQFKQSLHDLSKRIARAADQL